MPRKALTLKQRSFVHNYTDKNNPVTFGNGTQSVLNSYNVSSSEVAKVVASQNLTKTNVSQAIERKTRSKEQIENSLVKISERIEQALENDITLENVPLIRESREHNMSIAKLNGLLIDKQMNVNVNIDANDEEVKQRLNELMK